MQQKTELAQKVEAFRSSMNKQDQYHSDRYYIEHSVELDGIIFTAMSRECLEGRRETAYSVVYVIISAQPHPQLIYYYKFWDSAGLDSGGRQRNASVFIKRLNVTQDGGKYFINAEAEDGKRINLEFSP